MLAIVKFFLVGLSNLCQVDGQINVRETQMTTFSSNLPVMSTLTADQSLVRRALRVAVVRCRLYMISELPMSVKDWIYDCQWLTDGSPCVCNNTHTLPENHLITGNTGARYHLAAARAHNSVVLCCWWSGHVIHTVYCQESCILYLFTL